MNDDFTFSLAMAIFKSSKKNGIDSLINLDKELQEINLIFKNNRQLSVFFNHPVIDFKDKIKMLENLTVNNLILRFLKILIRFKKLSSLSYIVYYLSTLVKIETKMLDAEIKLPFEIDNETEQNLKKSIEKFAGKNINLKIIIDNNIIGGVYLKIGNIVIDNTLNNELQQIKERFVNK